MPSFKKKLISLKNVGVCYSRLLSRKDQYWALKDVSFDLYSGETLGVIGRNGAGKSTLMRLLAGIILPNIGKITNHGVSVQLLSLQVGFDAQLSGRANAIMSGMLLGMRRRDVIRALPEIMEFSELEEFIDEPVKTYSTGMRARLGFAISVHASPEVLLVDEVLGVGDALFRQKSQQVMEQRIQSNETVVIVSHQEDTLRKNCDRLVWIENGVTQMEGETEEVLAEYTQRILASKK